MLPFTDLPYFLIILIVAAPAVLLGVAERPRRRWILVATALMAAVHFGPRRIFPSSRDISELWVAVLFAGYQLGLLSGFAWYRARRKSRLAFAAAILLGLFPLAAVKIMSVAAPGSVVGFLGISYLTFRALDTLIIVEDRLETEILPGTYLAFLFFPPTISAGPIDRYRRFREDYRDVPPRWTFLHSVDEGVGDLFRGLLYKFVIAALIQDYAMHRAESLPGLGGALAYMYSYSLYLFFDFAGYSAIAMAISRLFGVRTPANFDRPFAAASIAEFWNRWHISLSFWFRDHVYMRFVLAATKGRWFGGRRHAASRVGILLTFLLMGAWHGLEWRYLAYGLYHATLLIGHQLVNGWTRRRPKLAGSKAWRRIGIVATFNVVCVGFLIFSGYLG